MISESKVEESNFKSMKRNEPQEVLLSLSDSKRESMIRSIDNVDDGVPDVVEIIDSRVEMPLTMRIMDDVLISSIIWLRQYPERVIRMGITHLVIPEELVTE